MSEPQRLTLRAPAKINLHLSVVGRREDGYHLLETVMVPVSLFDDLTFALTGGGGVELAIDGRNAFSSGPDNLVWRAADAFARATGIPVNVRIELTKRIPVAAGLGGGSSDAAATLIGLNRLYGEPLGSEDLADVGLSLGADVPFFLYGRPAVARGVGERLSPFRFNVTAWFLLANPGFSVSTAEVFRRLNYGLTIPGPRTIVPAFVVEESALSTLLHNDLESITFRLHASVREMRNWLAGRVFVGALMSGSGPTVFAVLRTQQEGYQLLDLARTRWKSWSCYLVEAVRTPWANGE